MIISYTPRKRYKCGPFSGKKPPMLKHTSHSEMLKMIETFNDGLIPGKIHLFLLANHIHTLLEIFRNVNWCCLSGTGVFNFDLVCIIMTLYNSKENKNILILFLPTIFFHKICVSYISKVNNPRQIKHWLGIKTWAFCLDLTS